jgi:cell division protein FtsQ
MGRLVKFYKYGLNNVGWNKYSYIDIQFDNQIICRKRDAALHASTTPTTPAVNTEQPASLSEGENTPTTADNQTTADKKVEKSNDKLKADSDKPKTEAKKEKPKAEAKKDKPAETKKKKSTDKTTKTDSKKTSKTESKKPKR